MDNELYKLCKEVYEKTGWTVGDESWEWHTTIDAKLDSMFIAPKYYTDYLLEKLPAHFYGGTIAMSAETDEGPTRYSFFYEDNYETARVVHCKNVRLQGWDDTPLKALLKLTIALHDSGALK